MRGEICNAGGEFSHFQIWWEKKSVRRRREWGRPWWSVFCPVTHQGAPWEPWERLAASRPLLWFHALMLFALSGANCFGVAQKHPSCFIHNDDAIVQQHPWCMLRLSCGTFLYHPPLLLWVPALLPFPPFVFPPALHPPLLSSFLSPVFCAFLPIYSIYFSFILAPLSTAPLHWAACNHICTTSCQFDRIRVSFFCHLRRRWDWSFVSYLSRISGGRISSFFFLRAQGLKMTQSQSVMIQPSLTVQIVIIHIK